MAKPAYDPATGKPIFDPATGKPALNCGGAPPCYDQDCDTEGLNDAVITTDCEELCDFSDSYPFNNYTDTPLHKWTWRGGDCVIYGLFHYDFQLEVTCQDDGTWLVKIMAMWTVPDYVFEATIPAADIQCVGGQLTGTVELAGLDASQGGASPLPNCLGCTATVTF